jgi:hypothetical protein
LEPIVGQFAIRLAGLQSECIEQMEEYDVTFGAGRIGARCRGETVDINESSVNVVKHVGPDFANGCSDGSELLREKKAALKATEHELR